VDAWGHVRILQGDTVDIHGDTLHYFGDTRKAYLSGNVRLRDRKMRLTTPRLDFDLNHNVASYTTGATLRNEGTVLKSLIGIYYTDTKNAFFKKEITLTNPDYTLEADTLGYNMTTKVARFFGPTVITSKENVIHCRGGWYDTRQEIAQFTGGASLENPPQYIEADTLYYERTSGLGVACSAVIFRDTSREVEIHCQRARYLELEKTVTATGHPVMSNRVDHDTLYLTADTLRSVEDTAARQYTLFAYHNVRMYKSNLQGACDSMVWKDSDSALTFFQLPVLWSDSSQFTADTRVVFLRDKHIHRLQLKRNAMLASLSDSLVYDQISGRNIMGYFREDTLRRILVDGNGESIYFAKDEKGAYLGVNRATCGRMIIYLKNQRVNRIVFLEHPEAKMTPMDQVNLEDFLLNGFRWRGAERPRSREELLIPPEP